MSPKKFALFGGLVMLAMGLISLIPSLVGSIEGLPALRLQESYGFFLNAFPMNILNKAALIIFGVAGIWASQVTGTNLPRSIQFSRWTFAVMGVLAVLGLIPQTNTLNGYWPLFGNEVLVHAFFSILGAYFGFALTARVKDSGPAQTDFKTPLSATR